jgi:pseudaminic acid cytidylyltransferase
MSRICVITARGGSKRIPRKNIRPFHGRPIILYAIDAARAAGIFLQILVSTDDEEIANLAAWYDTPHIARPAELGDDQATTADVMKHAVQRYGYESSATVCCLYPCTPLLDPNDLREGARRLEAENSLAYVMPLARFNPPVQRSLRLNENGMVTPDWPEFAGLRTQDLTPHYYDPGQWYMGRAGAWQAEVPIYGRWTLGMEIPRERAIDIDDEADWRLAELLYKGGK